MRHASRMPHLSAFVRYNRKMFYVYLIQSQKNSRVYTGYTTDLKQRFTDHNSGKSPYTKHNRPYRLVYYEAYTSKSDAQKREQNLKLRSKAYGQLRNRIDGSLNHES